MNQRLPWAALTALFVCATCFAQPATQPSDPDGPGRPSPEATALRDAATSAADLIYRQQVTLRWNEQRIAELQVENAKLAASALPMYDPTIVLETGKTYVVPPGPLTIVLVTPGVKLVGIPGASYYPTAAGYGIHLKGDDQTVEGFTFDKPNAPPGGRMGIKPCVRTAGRRPRILNCTTGNVDTFVEAMPGTENGLIAFCKGGPGLRAAFIYGAGAKGLTITDCAAVSSTDENVVRFSPETGQISENVVVTRCDLGNPGSTKAALDCRHVKGVTVLDNIFRQSNGQMAVRLGDSDLPGLSDLDFRRNKVIGGFVHAKALSAGAFDSVEFYGLNPLKDSPLQFDPASKLNPTNVLAYTVGPVPPNPKKIPGVGNGWKPAP